MKKIPRKKSTYQSLYFVSHILFFLYAYFLGFGYVAISLFLGLFIFNLSAALYQHRVISHNGFHFSKTVHLAMCILFSMCNFGSVAVNSAIHINHHRYMDTDKDPHDFKRIGYFTTVLKNWKEEHFPNKRFIVSFLKRPELKWQHYNHMKFAIFACLFLPFIPVVAFWAINLLFIITHLGHDKDHSAINVPLLFPLMWGDEMHKDHHDYPTRMKMHQYDLLYYIGAFLESLSQVPEKSYSSL
jgi:fatty-acid desaturase